MRTWLVVLVLVLAGGLSLAWGQDDALNKAAKALRDGQPDVAVQQAELVLKANPKSGEALLVRGQAYNALREYDKAKTDLDDLLKLSPMGKLLQLGHMYRGMVRYKSADIAGSIADFEKLLELDPKARPELWQYGIALYYAERYADGAKLFTDHRTVNPEDVENAFWHFICNVRAGKDQKQARAEIIPVRRDSRVPMAEIQQLIEGKLKPADVLAAASRDDLPKASQTSRLFYAHLYVGLYHEALGDAKLAETHIRTAVEKHKVPDYMWDVGNVHLKLRSKK